MKSLTKITFILFIGLLSFSSCTNNDTSQEKAKVLNVTKQDIIGEWEIVEATRNGEATDAMNGAFLRFESSGQVFSNLTGEEQMDHYVVENNVIKQTGSMGLEYTIKSKENNQMMLDLKMQNFSFEFTVKKK